MIYLGLFRKPGATFSVRSIPFKIRHAFGKTNFINLTSLENYILPMVCLGSGRE